MKKQTNPRVTILSHVIDEETLLYGGGHGIRLKSAKSLKEKDSCNSMAWSFPNHTGTHLDAPLHFINGAASVTELEPSEWVFTGIFLKEIKDTAAGYIIKPEDISGITDCELLLIKTGFERYRKQDLYWQDSPGLHPDLAAWLRQKSPSLRAVGVDFISISNLKNRELGKEAHRAFLKDNILLIEDMKLSPVKKAPLEVIIAPLLVRDADGAPCTVLAMED